MTKRYTIKFVIVEVDDDGEFIEPEHEWDSLDYACDDITLISTVLDYTFKYATQEIKTLAPSAVRMGYAVTTLRPNAEELP